MPCLKYGKSVSCVDRYRGTLSEKEYHTIYKNLELVLLVITWRGAKSTKKLDRGIKCKQELF